jgi:hypothetical protein
LDAASPVHDSGFGGFGCPKKSGSSEKWSSDRKFPEINESEIWLIIIDYHNFKLVIERERMIHLVLVNFASPTVRKLFSKCQAQQRFEVPQRWCCRQLSALLGKYGGVLKIGGSPNHHGSFNTTMVECVRHPPRRLANPTPQLPANLGRWPRHAAGRTRGHRVGHPHRQPRICPNPLAVRPR